MKLCDYILYQLLRFVKNFIELMPFFVDKYIGELLGRTVYHLAYKRKKITVENIKKAFPDKNPYWYRNTARKVFENFGRNLMEFIKFSSGRYFYRVEINGFENVENGVLLMTGHLGNWEITGMSIAYKGKKLYPIGRRIHNKAFDRIVNEMRIAFGGYHIPNTKAGFRDVLRKIKSKQNICVLIDQRIKNGLPVKFFNRPVWATHIISVLHRRTGVKVIPGYSCHQGKNIKVVYEKPIEMVNKEDSLKSDFINTQTQMQWIEEKIRQNPDEWFWMHNFWKDRWPAVFLDRDGTIIQDKGYIYSKEDLSLIPGAVETLRLLKKSGYLLVVITNQSGISRGYFNLDDYKKFNNYFLETLRKEGVIIDRVYHCPHHPDDNCPNRKPNSGMILKAEKELNIDLKKSFIVGDKTSDIETGKRLGIKNILVLTGHGKDNKDKIEPDYTVENISKIGDIIKI
ncbi:MAG: D-glycero-beta-D-manno-heptose 1,7-bisphosphate 7-phosphatase [Atribacterota bacterium]